MHGLPLPNLEWDGWLYIREAYEGNQKPAVMPPVDPPQKPKRKKDWSSTTSRRDDDVPF